MPVLKFNGQQYTLQPGQNRLGGGTTADVAVGGNDVIAIVDLGADGRASIRKTGNDNIRVNGTPLSQPTPLIHGDKVEIAGNEVYFADDVKQGGSTQFVSAADVAAIAAAKRSGPARGTLNTGGRLVSLVDGKEYPIPEAGITIGRDASADIVVAQTAVSRRHAQVIPSGGGYVVNDLSTNGVFVNGEKAASGQTLSRADVIRVGTEEFRFYADLAPIAKPGAAPAAAAPATPPPPPKPAAPVSTEATGRVPTLPPATPAAAPAAAPPKPVAPPAAPATAKPATPAKAPTPQARPASPPPPSNPAPSPAPAPAAATSKGVPTWLGLVVVAAVAAAVAAYFILASKN